MAMWLKSDQTWDEERALPVWDVVKVNETELLAICRGAPASPGAHRDKQSWEVGRARLGPS